MLKMDLVCNAFQDEENGPKDKNIDQILQIAEQMHQEYTDLHKKNEALQNQVEHMIGENEDQDCEKATI